MMMAEVVVVVVVMMTTMMMIFAIYIIHQTSLQHSNKVNEMGKTCSMHGGVMRNEYTISTGKHEGKAICRRLRHRRVENHKK